LNLFLPEQILAIHTEFDKGNVPHAFGGAIALAYYGQPRATYDIDINIALPVEQHGRVLDCLTSLFPIENRARVEGEIMRSTQTRLRWEYIPVDLFFADIPFHESIAARSREVEFAGTKIPIISAEDLIICKAAHNRGKDWPDIENIFRVQGMNLDFGYLRHWLDEFFPPDNERIGKIERHIRNCERSNDTSYDKT